METPSEASKKVSIENLPKEEIIKKYQDLIALLKKAMQNKELLTKENNALKEKLETNSPVTNELVETLTQQKLSLVNNLEEVKSQKDAISNNLKKSETDLHDAHNKINELDIENKSFQRQIQRLSEENEQLLLHLDSLENKLDKAKNVETQVKSLELEKSDLSNELLAKQVIINELQKNNNELTAQYAELKNNIETLEKNYQNAEMIICELRATIKESTQQREIYLSESDDLNVELHKNKALVEKLQQDLKAMSSKLSYNQIELSGYASDLQNTNEKLKDKVKHFHCKLVKFATDVKVLKQDKTNILESFKNYIEQAKTWEAQLKDYAQRMLNEFRNMEMQFKLESDGIKAKLTETEGLLQEKITEHKSHSVNVQQLNETILELKTNLEETKMVESRLNDEIKNLREENHSLTLASDQSLVGIKKENLELLAEMNEMNQALKTRGEAISKQQEYCDDLLANIKQKETVIKEYLETIQSKNDIINNLEGQLNSLKQDSDVQTNAKIDMQDLLDKKDQEIAELQKEIAHLHENLNTSQDVSYAESEAMSTSTISKTEEANRLKDLDGSWEERYSKLRTLALKLKGKIRELTVELNKEQNEKLEIQQKLTESVKTSHTIHSQCDKVQDELDEYKSQVKGLLKKLDVAALDISNSKKQLAENEEIITKLNLDIEILNKEKVNTDTWKKQVSAKVQSMRKELDANTLLKKDFENQISKLNHQLEERDKTLKAEIEKHNTTRNSLHESNNECKKQSVLNLEMQDYERSLKDLTQKLDKRQELVNKLKNQIDSQKSSVNTLKEENRNLEERLQNGEQDLNVAHSEIQAYKKSIGDLEGMIMEKDNKVQSLVESLESSRLENENLSSQLSKTMSEHQKAYNGLKAERDYLRGQNLGLEEKWRDLSETLRLRENELSEVSKEYQGYKVRAQSVLRQNQTRDVGLEEKLTEEVATFKTQTSALTSEMSDLRNKLEKVNEEKIKIYAENESLMRQQRELDDNLKEQQSQYEVLTREHQSAIAEHAEAIRGLKIHAETLAQCYRQQLSEQEVRHNREIIELQSKLEKGSSVPEISPVSLPTIPREQGEGSENVESTYTHPIPLNRLLSSESEHEVDFLKKQATDNDAKIVHLTALLADTEQDLAKHVQMNNLLKEEIRRQQRSVEREKHADNLEYLKNVVFKFATLSSGDERSRLVPVLNTILKFSPEEISKLNLVARSDFSNRGWTNYLPMWPTKPQ
ncbi:hypothetical protein RI129_005555 [Pyrocoelia pectoralis]|uniref:GRIP domain-containing protein n=1 Tax=Pyrocoelia pectoralis TaxID=417401 RepID=A0AAN7ZSH5_9COLE